MNSIIDAGIPKIAVANGLELSDEQIALLDRYARLLVEWNSKINLISRKDEENIATKHILHSLTLAMPHLVRPEIPHGARVLDLGSGGGLPGIPLKIVRPDLALVLCDSIQKKMTVVAAMIRELKLDNISAITSRAEEIKPSKDGLLDVVVSRAVAPLEDLIIWTGRILKPDGMIYALKGGDISEEIAVARKHQSVDSIEVKQLALKEFDGFATDGKLLVLVQLKG